MEEQRKEHKRKPQWALFSVVALYGGIALIPLCYVLSKWRGTYNPDDTTK